MIRNFQAMTRSHSIDSAELFYRLPFIGAAWLVVGYLTMSLKKATPGPIGPLQMATYHYVMIPVLIYMIATLFRGYFHLGQVEKYRPWRNSRSLSMLRGFAFLAPYAIFAGLGLAIFGFYSGMFPRQQIGYNIADTAVLFAWENVFWPFSGFVERLFGFQTPIPVKNWATELFAYVVRALGLLMWALVAAPFISAWRDKTA